MSDEVKVPLPGRTFERNAGCWSCTHYSTVKDSPITESQWFLHRAAVAADLKAKAKVMSLRLPNADTNVPKDPMAQVRDWIARLDRDMEVGVFGLCTKGVKPGWVQNSYFCGTQWQGRQGYSVATGGLSGRLNETPEELRERIDGPDPDKVA